MDDLRKSSMPFNLLLRVLDRYCIDLPVKHKEGGCFWNPEYIFVTCPRIPSKEFVFRDRFADGAECVYEDVGQLERRCTIIREYCVPLINGLDAWVNHRGAAAWAALMDRCYPVQESGNSIMDVPSE